MKKILLVSIAVLSLLVVSGCGNDNKPKYQNLKEEKIQTNTNSDVIGDQEINGIKLSNASVVYEDNQSTLTVTVTNVSDLVIVVDSVLAKYTYADGTTSVLSILVDSPLVPSQKVDAVSSTAADMTKAIKVEYEIVYSKN